MKICAGLASASLKSLVEDDSRAVCADQQTRTLSVQSMGCSEIRTVFLQLAVVHVHCEELRGHASLSQCFRDHATQHHI